MGGWIFQVGARVPRVGTCLRFGVSEGIRAPRVYEPVFLLREKTPSIVAVGTVTSSDATAIQVRVDEALEQSWAVTTATGVPLARELIADPGLCARLTALQVRALRNNPAAPVIEAMRDHRSRKELKGDMTPGEPSEVPIPRALSIRQPWAELIMRGIKTIECRSQLTKIRARVYIYASATRNEPAQDAAVGRRYGIDVEALSRGVVIGTVEIVGCRPVRPSDSKACAFRILPGYADFGWHLARPARLEKPRKPKNHPNPVWFTPF